jgi:hypothetical protein
MFETKSFVISKKQELFDQLWTSLDESFPREDQERPASLGEWAEKTSMILDGRPFTFRRHEYLIVPYQDTHPHQVEMKSAQLGLTSKAMLRALYDARFRGYRGILYLFPSKTDVLDFSKGRISPLIEENPEIRKWVRDTDAAGIKQIWNTFLYLRGMNSRIGLKSIPVDFIIFDELDEAPQNAVDMAMERMAHSEVREVLKLSNPTLPDYGIDKAFQETDQRYWMLKCPSCGEYTCLEDTFPSCLLETPDGRVIRACQKCKAELNPAIGEWVAKRPDVRDKRGYHYSQLFSQFVDPKDILHQFRTTQNLTDFYNLKIGIPWVEATHRIALEAVYALCDTRGMAESDPGPCSMGVDQGKDLHVVIGRLRSSQAGEIIHLGVYKEWEKLDQLMKDFNVCRCVIDGMPDINRARALAKNHPGKVYLNFYNEHQKGSYKWNQKDWTVSSNRTESLDASHSQILGAMAEAKGSSQVTLPKRCQMVEEFAQHLHNVAKRLEEDEETGSKRYVYVRLGPDHFRHAFNYECMARGTFANMLFPEFL